jgi:hypothetical protein
LRFGSLSALLGCQVTAISDTWGCNVDENSFLPAVSFASILDLRFLNRLPLHV